MIVWLFNLIAPYDNFFFNGTKNALNTFALSKWKVVVVDTLNVKNSEKLCINE